MRALLRDATGDIHERLHHAPLFARLAHGQLDWPGYRHLLKALAGFHFGLEPARRRGARALGLDPANPRLDLLAADLASLACAWTPRFGDEPDPDWSVGCFYVIEGSVVGGRVLHRQLDMLFGRKPDGRRFFRGPDEAGQKWRRSCAALEAYQPVDAGRVVAGAVAAFGLFEHGLAAEG